MRITSIEELPDVIIADRIDNCGITFLKKLRASLVNRLENYILNKADFSMKDKPAYESKEYRAEIYILNNNDLRKIKKLLRFKRQSLREKILNIIINE